MSVVELKTQQSIQGSALFETVPRNGLRRRKDYLRFLLPRGKNIESRRRLIGRHADPRWKILREVCQRFGAAGSDGSTDIESQLNKRHFVLLTVFRIPAASQLLLGPGSIKLKSVISRKLKNQESKNKFRASFSFDSVAKETKYILRMIECMSASEEGRAFACRTISLNQQTNSLAGAIRRQNGPPGLLSRRI